jgi:hypothetical protein
LAAQQLDEMWDSQVSILNTSYPKTLELLSAGKAKEAYEEFHANFLQAVKKIYSEASTTYPARFSKIDDWCGWVKGLYVDSARADKALAVGQCEDASKSLAALREDFFKLHMKTGMLQVNDIAYAIRIEAVKDQPSADEIRNLSAKLADAKPSSKTRTTPAEFAGARGRFLQAVNSLVSGNKIESAEIKPLRDAADQLYKAFGIEFE